MGRAWVITYLRILIDAILLENFSVFQWFEVQPINLTP
jgi:hypothetical protein